MSKGFSVAFGLAAVVVWSSWGVLGQAAAMRGAPAARHALSAREKLELSARLRAAVTEPSHMTRGDVKAARKAHGEEAGRLFDILRKSSR